jgi:hypothetical protein
MVNESGINFPPAFIVGVPRSGTTLLVNMAGGHPQLAPLYETRFLRNLLVFCQRLCWFHGRSWSRHCARIIAEPWTRSHFIKESAGYRSKAIGYHPVRGHCIRYERPELVVETDKWLQRVSAAPLECDGIYRTAREYIDSLFAIHCARMNKPYWVNKTPGLLAYLEPLHRLYPDGRCIHIVRDGRDVVASNQVLGWGPKEVRAWARRWKSLIQKGRAGAARAHFRYMEIRYENLVASPRETMSEVARFYGLQSDPDAMAHSVRVSTERNGKWRSAWSLSERRDFEREAGDLLIELGYEKNSDWTRRKD